MSWEFLSYSSITSVVDKLIGSLSEACERIVAVGELPGASPSIKEIRLLLIPKAARFPVLDAQISPELGRVNENLQLLQSQGAVVRLGHNRYLFKNAGGTYPFRLIISAPDSWITSRFQATSGRDLYISIATAAKNLGLKWVPARGGFEDLKTGEVRLATNEKEIFEIARLPFVPLEKRCFEPVFAMKKSGLPPNLTKEQLRAWAAAVSWTDTKCGGEAHQYTFRKARDEQSFVHVAEYIREYGYDGKYLRKKWRYLDLDDHFYFTCGAPLETTSLINRKRLRQPETPWMRNPVPWVSLTQPNQSARDLQKRKSNEQLKLWDFAAGQSPLAIQESIPEAH